jgi:hypothetical protein
MLTEILLGSQELVLELALGKVRELALGKALEVVLELEQVQGDCTLLLQGPGRLGP